MTLDFSPGKVIKEYTKAETKRIVEAWMSVFCKNKQGFDTKSYRWHIFSGGGYPSVEGDEAVREYREHFSSQYIVIDNGKGPAILLDGKPTELHHIDCCVCPKNLAWTMAFTHEEGWLGPYFAKHPKYKELEKENLLYKKKLEQIAIARKKGWI